MFLTIMGTMMRLEEMKQPRVERLSYYVHVAPEVEFDSAMPLECDWPEFHWKLSGDTLSLTPKVRFSTEKEVREAVEPLLKAWEIQAGLNAGGPVFTFEFRAMRVIDEAGDSPSGYGLHHMPAASLDIVRRYNEYPSPPSASTVTPDIETLWFRYSRYKQGHEPLRSMAYFCFTVLTSIPPRGAGAAAKHFNIDSKVLSKLSELSSITGDITPQRKKTGQLRPVIPARKKDEKLRSASREEEAWLEAVIPAILRTMMVLAATGHAPRLDMSQLPPL